MAGQRRMPIPASLKWGLIVLLEIIAGTLILSPERLVAQIERERDHVGLWHGPHAERRVREQAQGWVERSGLSSALRRAQAHVAQPTSPNFAPLSPMMEAAAARLPIIEQIAAQALYRLQVLGLQLKILLPLLIVGVVDGAVVMARRRSERRMPRSKMYHAARRTLRPFLWLPLVIVCAPIGLSPVVYLLWVVGLIGLIWMMMINVEGYL